MAAGDDDWWEYIVRHRDAMARCATLWGGVTCSSHAFQNALHIRNTWEMQRILNEIWARAPDSMSSYEQPGFPQICELLDGSISPDDDDEDADSSE